MNTDVHIMVSLYTKGTKFLFFFFRFFCCSEMNVLNGIVHTRNGIYRKNFGIKTGTRMKKERKKMK